MKKPLQILWPALTLCLLLGAQTVQGDYTVNVGDIFFYDIISAEQEITIGVNSISNSTFRLGGHYFPGGTRVQLNVTEVDPLGVDYNISAEGYSKVRVVLDADKSKLQTYVLRPFTLLEEVCLTTWNQSTFAKKHLGALLLPFLKPETAFWDSWKDHAEAIHNDGTFLTETFTDSLFVDATYTNTSNEFIFEFILRGDYSTTLSSGDKHAIIDVELLHQFQFAYDKISGVMLGIRMEGTISGTTNGTLLSISYSYHSEEQDYDLPNYRLDNATWPIPGFRFGLTFTGMAILVATLVLIRQKKNKR